MTNSPFIDATQKWLQAVVVGLNFCPFAKREVDKGSIRYALLESSKRRDILEAVLQECVFLDTHKEVETTLLILPHGLAEFSVYLDVLDLVESLLVMEDYEGVYQVASFHPEYCFADADVDDAANYTNRSPYPMLHLLREESLEKAIASYADIDNVPDNNIKNARELGVEKLRYLFEQSKV
jgi:hypothetical protein